MVQACQRTTWKRVFYRCISATTSQAKIRRCEITRPPTRLIVTKPDTDRLLIRREKKISSCPVCPLRVYSYTYNIRNRVETRGKERSLILLSWTRQKRKRKRPRRRNRGEGGSSTLRYKRVEGGTQQKIYNG